MGQKQRGENEVKAAELAAEILLEARMQGEANGMTLMRAADSFIAGLNETVENVTSRVDLYKLHETLKGHNTDINNLASGKAELYLTPSNVNLKLQMGGAAQTTGGRRLEDAKHLTADDAAHAAADDADVAANAAASAAASAAAPLRTLSATTDKAESVAADASLAPPESVAESASDIEAGSDLEL